MSVLFDQHGNRLVAREQVLTVTGRVDFESAAPLAAAGSRWLASRSPGSTVTFDLGGVDQVSSAAISVLLEWTRRARAQRIEVVSVHLSAPLLRLTRVAGLASLLPLDEPVAMAGA